MGGVGSGRKPREYPAEIIDLVCGMYRDGMTVAEIRKAAPKGAPHAIDFMTRHDAA